MQRPALGKRAKQRKPRKVSRLDRLSAYWIMLSGQPNLKVRA